MRKFHALLCIFTAAVFAVCVTPLTAQEVVYNGDFETETLTSYWALTGDNQHTEIATFDTVQMQFSPCLKRRPGTPDDNGGIAQKVHLFGGMKYHFTADIAAQECG